MSIAVDFSGVLEEFQGNATPGTAGQYDQGIPESDDLVAIEGDELEDSAASEDEGESTDESEDPEVVALRDRLSTEIRTAVATELSQEYQKHFRNFQSVKDQEVASERNAREEAEGQAAALLAFIKAEMTPERGFDEATMDRLENRLYKSQDQVRTQRVVSAQEWGTGSTLLEDGFNSFCVEAVSDDKGQQLASPAAVAEHPEVKAAKKAAFSRAERWYARGRPENTPEHQASRDAFRHLKETQLRIGRGLIATAKQTTTAQEQKASRTKQQAAGPQAPASTRTGGTGGRMTDDKAWALAEKQFPSDDSARHARYMAILMEHNL